MNGAHDSCKAHFILRGQTLSHVLHLWFVFSTEHRGSNHLLSESKIKMHFFYFLMHIYALIMSDSSVHVNPKQTKYVHNLK